MLELVLYIIKLKIKDIALWHYKAFAFMSKLNTLLGWVIAASNCACKLAR